MCEIREVEDKKIWERFVLAQKPSVFLQSWNWGEFRKSLGEKIFRLGFWEGKKLIGVAFLVKEEARRGTYLACPGGPLIDWEKEEIFSKFVSYTRELGKKEGAVFARVRPSVIDSEKSRQVFRKLGFVKAPMHMHAETTLCLDISGSEEDILAGMRKNTRYSIRRALREGVRVEISKDVNDVEDLYGLQMEVVRRRGFVPFSKEFFKKHFLAFVGDGQIAFIKAVYKGEALAIGMFVFYGETIFYHYSGSSLKHAHVFSSYAMLWGAIKEGRKRGCRVFDLWGVAPDNSPRHRFAGVTTFKKGFGGERVNYLHAHDLPLGKRYWLTFVFEMMRKLSRRL